jgi:hypothetical protein
MYEAVVPRSLTVTRSGRTHPTKPACVASDRWERTPCLTRSSSARSRSIARTLATCRVLRRHHWREGDLP